MEHPDIVGLSIATRPDCLGKDALAADALELLPENVVIHRLTGDGAKRDLIAPKWSGDKKRVLADMNRVLRAREIQPARE